MDGDIEAAQQRWRDSGPLSQESLRLLLDWREVNLTEQSDDLVFAAFVRSLTLEQQSALVVVIELVDTEEAFRWFYSLEFPICATVNRVRSSSGVYLLHGLKG